MLLYDNCKYYNNFGKECDVMGVICVYFFDEGKRVGNVCYFEFCFFSILIFWNLVFDLLDSRVFCIFFN